MATQIYKEKTWKSCPRCNGEEAIIEVFHFGATHIAQCSKCGLKGSHGDSKETALAQLVNKYFEYEASLTPSYKGSEVKV